MKKLLLLAAMPLLFSCSGDDNNSVSSISDISFVTSTGYSVQGFENACYEEIGNQELHIICVTEETMNAVKEDVLSRASDEPGEDYCPKATFTGIDGEEYTLYVFSWGTNPENECKMQE